VKTKGENTPDVVDYRTYNDYFKYLVTVIEVYRKYAWIVPMKSHKGNCIVAGLCSIIGALKPRKLWVNHGSELSQRNYLRMASKQ
jgi:hypothetical protein